jgi:hypothetical protein
MKYAVEMHSGAVIFMKIGSGIKSCEVGIYRHADSVEIT